MSSRLSHFLQGRVSMEPRANDYGASVSGLVGTSGNVPPPASTTGGSRFGAVTVASSAPHNSNGWGALATPRPAVPAATQVTGLFVASSSVVSREHGQQVFPQPAFTHPPQQQFGHPPPTSAPPPPASHSAPFGASAHYQPYSQQQQQQQQQQHMMPSQQQHMMMPSQQPPSMFTSPANGRSDGAASAQLLLAAYGNRGTHVPAAVPPVAAAPAVIGLASAGALSAAAAAVAAAGPPPSSSSSRWSIGGTGVDSGASTAPPHVGRDYSRFSQPPHPASVASLSVPPPPPAAAGFAFKSDAPPYGSSVPPAAFVAATPTFSRNAFGGLRLDENPPAVPVPSRGFAFAAPPSSSSSASAHGAPRTGVAAGRGGASWSAANLQKRASQPPEAPRSDALQSQKHQFKESSRGQLHPHSSSSSSSSFAHKSRRSRSRSTSRERGTAYSGGGNARSGGGGGRGGRDGPRYRSRSHSRSDSRSPTRGASTHDASANSDNSRFEGRERTGSGGASGDLGSSSRHRLTDSHGDASRRASVEGKETAAPASVAAATARPTLSAALAARQGASSASAPSSLPPAAFPLSTVAPPAPALPSSFTHPVTLVQRGYVDVAARYPALRIPPHFLRAVSCWAHTLPVRVRALGQGGALRLGPSPHATELELPSLIALPTTQPPLSGGGGGRAALNFDACAAAAVEVAAAYSAPTAIDLHPSVSIVVDAARTYLAAAASTGGGSSDGSNALALEDDPLSASTISAGRRSALPSLRFNVRVVLLSTTAATAAPPSGAARGLGGNGNPAAQGAIRFPPSTVERSLQLLVMSTPPGGGGGGGSGGEASVPDGGVVLLGGPWSADLDGGNPLVEDSPLVRAAVRHVRAQASLDLSPCTAWAKFMEVHSHTPPSEGDGAANGTTGGYAANGTTGGYAANGTTGGYAAAATTAGGRASSSSSSSSSPEAVEVTVVLLCLDSHRAAASYSADGSLGTWVAVASPEEGEGAAAGLDDGEGDSGVVSTWSSLLTPTTTRADLAQLVYGALRTEARSRGLDTRGKKEDIVERLMVAAAVIAGVSGPSGGKGKAATATNSLSSPSPSAPPSATPSFSSAASSFLVDAGPGSSGSDRRGAAEVGEPGAVEAPPPPAPPRGRVLLARPPQRRPGPTPSSLGLVSLASLVCPAPPTGGSGGRGGRGRGGTPFETALIAEGLREMLARDYGHVLAAALSEAGAARRRALRRAAGLDHDDDHDHRPGGKEGGGDEEEGEEWGQNEEGEDGDGGSSDMSVEEVGGAATTPTPTTTTKSTPTAVSASLSTLPPPLALALWEAWDYFNKPHSHHLASILFNCGLAASPSTVHGLVAMAIDGGGMVLEAGEVVGAEDGEYGYDGDDDALATVAAAAPRRCALLEDAAPPPRPPR